MSLRLRRSELSTPGSSWKMIEKAAASVADLVFLDLEDAVAPAQKVAARAADMARRSFLRVAGVIENMTAFTCEHGVTYALFGEGGGQLLADEIGVELIGRIPLEPAVAAGGDAGTPVALNGTGSAAEEFRGIAKRIIDEIAPPVNMAGCSARLLDAVNAAFAARDAAATPTPS